MAMRRLPGRSPLGHSRWIGRRFPSAAALHEALDQLVEAGFDVETIMDHMPANPIVNELALDEATIGEDRAEVIALEIAEISEIEPEATPPADAGAALAEAQFGATQREPVADAPSARGESPATGAETRVAVEKPPVAPGGLSPVNAVLEYLSQINNLLANVHQPSRLCERFLRAVGVVMEFDQAAILVRRRVKPPADRPAELGDELVLVAARPEPNERGSGRGPGRSAIESPISSHELGPIVFSERKALMEVAGEIRPFNEESPATGIVAVPLAVGERVLGVWLARLDAQTARGWAGESARMMRLMAELLANRLQHVLAVSPSRHEPVPVWTQKELLAELGPEVARAQRHGGQLGLIRLTVHCERKGVSLPVEALARELRARLRPYDQVALHDCARGGEWNLAIAHADAGGLRALTERLKALVEDTLDANGGLEERGLKVALGASSLGVDAADALQLAVHAAHAARTALVRAEPSATEIYSIPTKAAAR
jgi:hypothetical protein